MTPQPPALGSGTITIGADLRVHRLGFGAMRITGRGIWGEPRSRDEAKRVVRRALELGVDFIDTADSYGPAVSESIIRDALFPYPDHLVIATKGGLTRQGPNRWTPDGRPSYLRSCVEMSLERLDVQRIDLYQLHRVDPHVPVEDSVGALKDMQDEGKIRYIGLSEVDIGQIERARSVVDIVTVQNAYNLSNRRYEHVLDHCEDRGIAFIPYFPLAVGKLANEGGIVRRALRRTTWRTSWSDLSLASLAEKHDAKPAQLALAWLLRRSPAILAIPGTGCVPHLEENCAAAEIALSDEEFERLSYAA